jgi:Mitochondrial domain of unknown function (DUF1713)
MISCWCRSAARFGSRSFTIKATPAPAQMSLAMTTLPHAQTSSAGASNVQAAAFNGGSPFYFQSLISGGRPRILVADQSLHVDLLRTSSGRAEGDGKLASATATASETCWQSMQVLSRETIADAFLSRTTADGVGEVMEASSTLKKRRLKMNKHKYRKRRKRDRRRTKK